MDKETIEALKKNKVPFGLLSVEMKNAFGDYIDDLEIYRWNGSGTKWLSWSASFKPDETYRLRQDYAPEPKIVIESCNVYLEVQGYKYRRVGSRTLACAMTDKDLIGIKSDGWIFGRIYKNKESGHMSSIIPVADLNKYEVLSIDAVLFSNAY